MYQRTELIGRVGQDAELRHTTGGQSVANFSVAVTEKYKNRTGEKQETTTWYKCAMWGKLAEGVYQYVKKGGLIFVTGTVEADSYEHRETHETVNQLKLTVRELKLLSSKRDGEAAAGASSERNEFDQGGGSDPSTPQEISDEDIPF